MKNPRIYEITELRKEVLEALAKYEFASRPQLYRIIKKRGKGKQETWERALRRALDLMERAGYISHGQAGKKKRWIHFITKSGAKALGGKTPYPRKPHSLVQKEIDTETRLLKSAE